MANYLRPNLLLTVLPACGAMLLVPTSVQAQHEHAGHVMEDAEMAEMPPPTSREHIRVVDDPEAGELTLVLGPIDLPGNASHHMEQLPVQEVELPFDLSIRGYRTEIYDGDGNPVPRVVLHHMNLLDPGRRELFLPIMQRVLAASHETPPVSFPGWLVGIPMYGGQTLLALAMLHNPTDVDYEAVTVRLIISYERSNFLPLYTLRPFHLDAMYPQVTDTKAWDLPPGFSSRSWEARPAISGLIVGLGGHLHGYATRLKLENLTTGQVLYDISPTLDPNGGIVDIPTIWARGRGMGVLIEPENTYRVTAEYWNPLEHTIVDGGMGSVAGAFIPIEEWPWSNTADDLYIQDYDWVLRSQSSHGGHGTGG